MGVLAFEAQEGIWEWDEELMGLCALLVPSLPLSSTLIIGAESQELVYRLLPKETPSQWLWPIVHLWERTWGSCETWQI